MFRALLILLLICLTNIAQAAIAVSAVRIWPAEDYTRITLESNQPINHKFVSLKNPDRLVLDLENVELNAKLKELADKIQANDPYIKQVRVANFKPDVVRLVIEIKQADVNTKIFALKPAGDYQNRLVIDIYPQADPLMAMIAQRGNSKLAVNTVSPQTTAVTEPEKANPETTAGDNKAVLPAQTQAESLPEEQSPETAKEPAQEQDKALLDKKKGGRQIVVAIDAGHGGEDTGAIGATGSYEKNITLAVAKKLKARIDAEPNMRAVLIRDGDYFIPLHTRVVKARKLRADLFISIHADAFIRPDARGSSVFALSERGATSASARYLAKKENESDLIGGVSLDGKDPYLARILLDLSQTATINDSLKLGKAVLKNLGEINTLHKSVVEQAGFAVLKSPDIPSILVETAFISNPEEEQKLNNDSYRDKLAGSILSGIKRYFSGNPALAKTKLARE